MVLDECPKLTDDKKILSNAIDTSTHWAKRCKVEFGNNKSKGLFGIVQGGLYKDLREESISNLVEIGFDGYAMFYLLDPEELRLLLLGKVKLISNILSIRMIYRH